MGHVIGDVTTDAITVDIPVDVVEAVARVAVDVVYTACITLFTSMMGVDDIVPVHTVRGIDPDEPTKI